MEEHYEWIGARIKELRLKAGHKNRDKFAWDKGISRTQMARFEKGHNMSIKSLAQVLEALDVSFEDFFQGISVLKK